jgi:hypothetical protein
MSWLVSEWLSEWVGEISAGVQLLRNVHRWKPLPSNGSENITVDTCVSVCVCVTRYMKESTINPNIKPKPICTHTHTRDNMFAIIINLTNFTDSLFLKDLVLDNTNFVDRWISQQ